MTHIRRDVDRNRLRVEAGEKRAEVHAATILTHHDRGDALADHGDGRTRVEQSAIVMTVRIDESRGQGQPVGVYDAFGSLRGELANGCDAIANHAHIGATAGRAAPVDDECVADERA